jgi:hypothetical protein
MHTNPIPGSQRISALVVWLTALAAMAALDLALGGCTTSTQDNFTNPPPGPPATCAPIATLTGCSAGSISYSCTSDRPDDGDTSLVCDDGTPGVGGSETLFCCAPYGQWATECVPATRVPGCGAQSLGFACAGESSPDQVDPSLVCSRAIAGDAGARDFCCVSVDQSSAICRCSSFDPDAGTCGSALSSCAGAAIGFDCAAGHDPTDLNAVLACAAPDGGSAGAFCCETP